MKDLPPSAWGPHPDEWPGGDAALGRAWALHKAVMEAVTRGEVGIEEACYTLAVSLAMSVHVLHNYGQERAALDRYKAAIESAFDLMEQVIDEGKKKRDPK